MLGFCEDFTLRVGRTDVTVHYLGNEVCWEASGQQFCYNGNKVIEFRNFINEALNRARTVTDVVNEFQRYFSIRRQRAFWVVESMLSPQWCVLEMVISPGCITDADYVPTDKEWSQCFENTVEIGDAGGVLIDKMRKRDIRLLNYCGGKAQYVKPNMRYVAFGETNCTEIKTDYEPWFDDVIKEAEEILYGE